jgi:hypothetical protein
MLAGTALRHATKTMRNQCGAMVELLQTAENRDWKKKQERNQWLL